MSLTPRRQTLIRSLLFIALLLVAGGLIVYLKRSTDVPLTPADNDDTHRMAVPDTAENLPAAPVEESTPAAPTEDPLGDEERDPAVAGYNDGYLSGNTDGMNNDERATYDESSQFPSAADRQTYAAAYRRGYAAGFADGRKQAIPAEEEHDNGGYEEPLPDNEAKTPAPKTTAPREERKAAPTPKPNTPREERKTTPRP